MQSDTALLITLIHKKASRTSALSLHIGTKIVAACVAVLGRDDHSSIGEVILLGVGPKYRGLGLGAKLLLRSTHLLQKTGIRLCFAQVAKNPIYAARTF